MALDRIAQNCFLVLGRAGLDLYADPPGVRVEAAQKYSSALGGSAANIAAGITRLGGVASLVSAVSDDAVGRFILHELKRYGIAAEHVRSVAGEARTSLAVVETRRDNCQSIIYRNGAADFQISEAQLREVPFKDFGALIVTGTAFAVEPSRLCSFLAMELARAAGLAIIFDVDYRPYSWVSAEDAAVTLDRVAKLSNIVVGNDEEFGVMAGGSDGFALAKELTSISVDVVVYKKGEHGSVTICKDKNFETPIFQVKALKPTGAGDSFLSAFVTSLASGYDLETSVRRGSAAAAIVVTRVACAPAMPTTYELADFIAGHTN